MSEINVSMKGLAQDYPIIIESGAIDRVSEHVNLERYSQIFIVTDKTVNGLYGDDLEAAIGEIASRIIIPQGENHKTQTSVDTIHSVLFDARADRDSILINLGGGLVGDVGGYAASTWQRGIDFVQVPTTLLAAADASVGGKTGINYRGAKNMIGSFMQPQAVIQDTDIYKDLPPQLFAEGMAEIIKHGAIADAVFFEHLDRYSRLPMPEYPIGDVLMRSCSIKKEVVEEDEREGGRRKILNYGHTIGHALESLSHLRRDKDEHLLHGEAVAIGMVAEALLGEHKGDTDKGVSDQIKNVLGSYDLPTTMPAWLEAADALPLISRDKKSSHGEVLWPVVEKIGATVVDCTFSEDEVQVVLNG